MRIVHFSDIHMAANPRVFQDLLDKRLLGTFNYLLRRRRHMHPEFLDRALTDIPQLKPDLVLCTGDITCIGSPAEFQRAVARLEPLANNPNFRFLYLPGNHDLYVPNQQCRQAFIEAFQRLNAEPWNDEKKPRQYQFHNVNLRVINECQPTTLISSSGRLPTITATHLEKWWRQLRQPGECRILCGHFPTAKANGKPLEARRRLHGYQTIEQALSQHHIDLHLCGHIHEPFRRQENSAAEICAGALTINGQLAIIDIDPKSGTWKHQWHACKP